METDQAVVVKAPPKTSKLKDFLAGGFGGVCLVTVGHPLDTIKVRLQTSTQYKGLVDVMKKTYSREGLFGFYKGMAAPLLGVTPMYAICFLGYRIGQDLQRTSPTQVLNINQIGMAGALSGVFTTAIMVPGDRIKVMLQVQDGSQKKYSGPIDVAKKVFQEAGIRGLYKGTGATLLRDVPGSYAYFAAYEYSKRSLATADGKLNPLTTLFCGGMAGVFNWLVALPADTLKSRYQSAPEGTYPNGIRSVFSEMIKKEGPLALYRGFGPVMLRAIPANAATFLGYEVAYKFLTNLGL